MIEQGIYPNIIIHKSIPVNKTPKINLHRITQTLLEEGMSESAIPNLSIVFKRGNPLSIIGQGKFNDYTNTVTVYTRPHEKRYIRTGLLTLVGKDPQTVLNKYHTALPSGILGHELKHAADFSNGNLPFIPKGRRVAWAAGLLFGLYQEGQNLLAPSSPGEKIGSLVNILLSVLTSDTIYYRLFDGGERRARRTQREIINDPSRWMVTV